MKRSLLLGCGNSRAKKVKLPSEDGQWAGELTTLDMNPSCGADIVRELEGGWYPGKLPFPDEHFDEIGCYDAMEHWGVQGDWKDFFAEFAEYHRILKPHGRMGIIVPCGLDAFADPGHKRFFSVNHFNFLSRSWYDVMLKQHDPITDYRWAFSYDFKIVAGDVSEHHIGVLLEKL